MKNYPEKFKDVRAAFFVLAVLFILSFFLPLVLNISNAMKPLGAALVVSISLLPWPVLLVGIAIALEVLRRLTVR